MDELLHFGSLHFYQKLWYMHFQGLQLLQNNQYIMTYVVFKTYSWLEIMWVYKSNCGESGLSTIKLMMFPDLISSTVVQVQPVLQAVKRSSLKVKVGSGIKVI